jgi:hypothetical protein
MPIFITRFGLLSLSAIIWLIRQTGPRVDADQWVNSRRDVIAPRHRRLSCFVVSRMSELGAISSFAPHPMTFDDLQFR